MEVGARRPNRGNPRQEGQHCAGKRKVLQGLRTHLDLAVCGGRDSWEGSRARDCFSQKHQGREDGKGDDTRYERYLHHFSTNSYKANAFLIALAMTLMTSPSDLIYEAASTPLKRAISHSSFTASKTAAIHTLGTCTFYGGASDDEILENMDFLLEIITSDGHIISAPDEPEPVTAALEEWGFLCTLIDDLSPQSEDAVEAFADQITSSFPSVQIAAGENIALLFEKSFKQVDPEEDSLADYPDSEIMSDPDETPGVPKLIRLYPAYRRTDQLIHSLQSIASISTHHLSKTDRKALRTNFADILNSVEYPTRGPRYQNAINDETGKRYGSRMVVRIHKGGVMRIDRWWKLTRLQGLKRVLQGGFVGHYEKNEVVFETLPIMMSNDR